jgi:hypothetical protein
MSSRRPSAQTLSQKTRPDNSRLNALPRSIISEDSTRLASVPIEAIASIAATLSGPQTSAHDAVIAAYRLLEVSMAAKDGLNKGLTYDQAISEHRASEEWSEMRKRERDSLPKDILSYDERGNPRNASFDAVLSKLMGKTPKSERPEIFRRWLIGVQECWHGDLPSREDVDAKIADWKKKGIPAEVYSWAWAGFPAWRKSDISRMRSESSNKKTTPKRKRKPRLPDVNRNQQAGIALLGHVAKKSKK